MPLASGTVLAPVLAQPRLTEVPQAQRLDYVDLMRAIAICMVLGIHVASAYVYSGELFASRPWLSANWFMGFLRPAVPIFLMLSGALLLQPSKAAEPIKTFYQKRVTRVLWPFLIWSAVFIGWRIFFLKETITLGDALNAFFQGNVYVHLWFMYVLLALYVVTPLLRQYIKGATQQNLSYALAVWFVASSLMPLLKSNWGFEFNLVYHLPVTGYIGFYLGGYYLNQISLPKQIYRLLPAIYCILALLTGATTMQLSQASGKLVDSFYGYTMPNTVVMAICLFLWLKELPYTNWAKQHQWGKFAINLVSKNSFGIYLIHLIFIDLFQSTYLGFQLNRLPITPWVTIPVFSLILLLLSILLLEAIARLPGGKVIASQG
jgi:surface polysaccharide O-acyltransferase-like enzyme